MEIIIAKEEIHGDIILAESYETAIKALINEGLLNRYTEANGGYYGGLDLEDLYGDDWEERIMEDYSLLEDLNIFSFEKKHLYLDKEIKNEN